MAYILIGLLFFGLIFYLHKKYPKQLSSKKIIIFVFLVVASLIMLRFGQVIPAIIAATLPLIFRIFGFLLRHIGIVNLFRYFTAKRSHNNANYKTHKISKKDAYQILDLKKEASKTEILSQYKKLIQKNHPDKGGSAYIAALINQAKDLLLK